MTPEQAELTRQCAQRIIENDRLGRVVDPVSLSWAQAYVRGVPPLNRLLGPGNPQEPKQ